MYISNMIITATCCFLVNCIVLKVVENSYGMQYQHSNIIESGGVGRGWRAELNNQASLYYLYLFYISWYKKSILYIKKSIPFLDIRTSFFDLKKSISWYLKVDFWYQEIGLIFFYQEMFFFFHIKKWIFMPPAWKVRRGHLVIGSSVRLSVCLSVCPSVCP